MELCDFYMRKWKNGRKEEIIYSEILFNRIGMDCSTLEKIKAKRFSYFLEPLKSIENMKKSLIILQAMLEKHNKLSTQLRNRNLEANIEFFEFMIEHYDEITEYFSAISTKLESLSKDEIDNLVQVFRLDERPNNIDFEKEVEIKRIAQGL